MSLPSLDLFSAVGVENTYNELIKVKSELAHIADPSDPNSVSNYLATKRKVLFQKILLTLYNLTDTILQRENINPAILRIIDRECDRVMFPHRMIALSDTIHSPYFVSDPLQVPGKRNFDAADALFRMLNLQTPISPTVRQRFFLSQSTLFVGMHQPVIFPLANVFLATLPDSDRNYANGEMMAIDLQFEDLLSEKNIYYASQPSMAITMQREFLETSLSLRQLKYYYCLSTLKIPFPQTSAMFKKLFTLYNETIWSKAVSIVRKQNESDGNDGDDAEDGVMPKSEMLIRQLQVEVLKQEVDKLLIHAQTNDVSVIFGHLIAETDNLVSMSASHLTDPVDLGDYGSKQRIFSDFIYRLMLNVQETRTETGDRGFILSESHLRSSLSHMSKDLMDWTTARHLEQGKSQLSQLKRLQHLLYMSERNLRYSEYLREQDKKESYRKIQTEVADKGYDLIFEIDTLNRKLTRSEEELKRQEVIVREKIKREYDDLVRQLTVEAIEVKTKFKEYRSQLQQDIMSNLFDAKKDALKKMVQSGSTPMELKRKTLKMIHVEDELNDLRTDKMALENLVLKLKSLHRLRNISSQSSFIKKLRKLEDEKSMINKTLWETRDEMEQKEGILRQQLAASQRALSSREQDIEILRKELEQQQRTKNSLIQWKVSKTHQLTEMESKLAQFEKWKNLNVDKLLLDLEKKDADLRKFTQLEDRNTKQTEMTEMRAQRELSRMRIDLAKEKKLKQDAFQKLEELRKKSEEIMAATEGSASARLDEQVQLLINENELLRQFLRDAGIDDRSVASSPSTARRSARPISSSSMPSARSQHGNAMPRPPDNWPQRPYSAPLSQSNILAQQTIDLRGVLDGRTPSGPSPVPQLNLSKTQHIPGSDDGSSKWSVSGHRSAFNSRPPTGGSSKGGWPSIAPNTPEDSPVQSLTMNAPPHPPAIRKPVVPPRKTSSARSTKST